MPVQDDFQHNFARMTDEADNNSYRISSDIRRTFFSFQNNPKDLDPSYKTDLDL